MNCLARLSLIVQHSTLLYAATTVCTTISIAQAVKGAEGVRAWIDVYGGPLEGDKRITNDSSVVLQ